MRAKEGIKKPFCTFFQILNKSLIEIESKFPKNHYKHYILILVNQARKSIFFSGTQKAAQVSARRRKEQQNLFFSLLILFCAFVVTWIPYGVLIALLGFKVDVVAIFPFG